MHIDYTALRGAKVGDWRLQAPLPFVTHTIMPPKTRKRKPREGELVLSDISSHESAKAAVRYLKEQFALDTGNSEDGASGLPSPLSLPGESGSLIFLHRRRKHEC